MPMKGGGADDWMKRRTKNTNHKMTEYEEKMRMVIMEKSKIAVIGLDHGYGVRP